MLYFQSMTHREHNQKTTPPLSERIVHLVTELESASKVVKQTFSYRAAFVRGILQGLGFVLGSTIVAGIMYTIITHFISPKLIHDMTLDSAVQKSLER